jgi:hypothetical protein
MDRKTENQLREELAAVWGMLDAERRDSGELRKSAERYLKLRGSIDLLVVLRDVSCNGISAPWPKLDGWVAVDEADDLDARVDALPAVGAA